MEGKIGQTLANNRKGEPVLSKVITQCRCKVKHTTPRRYLASETQDNTKRRKDIKRKRGTCEFLAEKVTDVLRQRRSTVKRTVCVMKQS